MSKFIKSIWKVIQTQADADHMHTHTHKKSWVTLLGFFLALIKLVGQPSISR